MHYLKGREFRFILSNTASQLLIRFTTSFTTFLVTLGITYFFGLNLFGSFTKITTFVSFFYLLVNFGINAVYLKEHYKDAEKLIPNVVFLRLVIATALSAIIIGITILLPYDPLHDTGFSPLEKNGIMLFSLTLFTQALILSINITFQKRLLYHLALIPNTISSLITLSSVFISRIYGALSTILLSYSVSGILFFLSSYFILKKKSLFPIRIEKPIQFSKQILIASFPLALMLSFNLIYFRVDTLILSLYYSSFDVGIYGFAYKIFEFIIAIPTFFSNSVYPLLIEKEKNDRDFYADVKTYSFFLLLLSFLCIALIFIFSPLIQYVRTDLTRAITPLKILSLSLPFFFLTNLLQWVLIIKNKKYTLLSIYIFAMVINILLDFIYIPSFGYISAAYITVISEMIVFGLILSIFFAPGLKISKN